MLLPSGGLAKSLGMTKNLTPVLQEIKAKALARKNRFEVKQDEDTSKGGFVSKSLFTTNPKITTNEKLLDNSMMIEMTAADGQSTARSLKSDSDGPAWQVEYETTDASIKELEKLLADFQKFKEQRLRAYADKERKDLDRKLGEIISRATSKLDACGRSIHVIEELMQYSSEDEVKLQKNLKQSIAVRVQDMAKAFRKQEKSLFDHLVHYGAQSPSDKGEKEPMFDDSGMEINIYDEELDIQRDEQITELVESINKISKLFRQLNDTVIEQGTMLDRIDFNIENSMIHMKKANKELKQANEIAESGVGRKCQWILIGLIICFTIVLVIKNVT